MKSIRFMFMLIVYVIVMILYYFQSQHALIKTTTQEVEQTLVNHEALRQIIRTYYIPEIKRLKEAGLLHKEYINPLFTSGTLLTEKLHEFTQPELLKKGDEPTLFRFASLNPINKHNKATDYEKKIFIDLRQSKKENFSEIIQENNQSYLFYAKFFPDMKKRCLQCHSTPDAAPLNQVKRYGSTHGYNYKVGDPSALITMRSPLDKKMLHMQKETLYIGLVVLFVFIFLYIISEWVIYHLHKQKNKIAKVQEIHNELIKEAKVDPLTGLLNRRQFKEIFHTELNRAKRDNKVLVFLFIDIDDFKKYNDGYGHVKGDNALKAVAKALQKCFNRSHESIFRLGGEEFAVISSHHDDDTNVLLWSENLNKELAHLNIEHKYSQHKHLSVSIGIYILRPDAPKIEMKDVLKKADAALYEAKNSGKNKAVIYQALSECHTLKDLN